MKPKPFTKEKGGFFTYVNIFMAFCTVLSSHEFPRVVYFILVTINSLKCEFMSTWLIQFIDKAAGLRSLGCIELNCSRNRSRNLIGNDSSNKVFRNRRILRTKGINSWLNYAGTARALAEEASGGGTRTMESSVGLWLAGPVTQMKTARRSMKGCASTKVEYLRAKFVFKKLPPTLTGEKEQRMKFDRAGKFKRPKLSFKRRVDGIRLFRII